MYAIVNADGSEWEVGKGTLTASSTLRRDVVRSSTNSNALVNFSAGTKTVFATVTAEHIDNAGMGQQIMQAAGFAMQ